MYNDIRPLTDCREALLDYLENQMRNNQDRNSDWFPNLIRDMDKYLYWTVCFREDKIVAFSAIQNHFFPEDTVRVLTRTFFDPSIRLSPGYSLWVETPVAPMVSAQLDWLRGQPEFKKAMITMETRHRRDYFSKIIGKINKRSKAQFEVCLDRFKTYPNQRPEHYHHAAIMTL